MSHEQQRLDFELRSRTKDPSSSHDAAKRARLRAGSDADRILIWIEAGAYDPSARRLAVLTGIEPYVVRKRTADLRRLGLAHAHEGPDPREPDGIEPDAKNWELRWLPGPSGRLACPRCRDEAKEKR